MTLGAALQNTTLVPVYTGNNVMININNVPIALVQHITIQRAVNRRPVQQIGTSMFADAPVTTTMATISCTGALFISGTTAQAYNAAGILPSGSLVNAINMNAYPMTITTNGSSTPVVTVTNAFYNGDSLDIAANDTIPINISFLAQDAVANV